MDCPQCNTPNPKGATHCNMCYEVFNRSAADRYLHDQKRAERNRGTDPPPSYDPDAPAVILSAVPRTDWGGLFVRVGGRTFAFVRRHVKVIGLAAIIVPLGVFIVSYSSTAKRMQIFGGRLEYAFPLNAPVGYLVSFHTDLKSWSERDGRLDTPLDTLIKDEIGNVSLLASALKTGGAAEQRVAIQPREWIVNATGGDSQSIPLSHPSLKPSSADLDHHGILISRSANRSPRLGRAAVFLMPRWPAGSHRPGDRWEEPVEWVDAEGDWKILWKGRLRWKLAGFESCEQGPCVRLVYQADVQPSLWESPSWATGGVRTVRFTGTSDGEATFDSRGHLLFSNDFTRDGTLTFDIDTIYRIPRELRVGRALRRGAGPDVPGVIVVQIKDKLNARKS